MENFEQKLRGDLRKSLLEKKSRRRDTIKLVLAACHNKEIEKRSKGEDNTSLTNEEILEVINKEAKKRKEAIALYEQGGRLELAQKEKEELKILEEYLPPPLSEEEMKNVIKEVLQRNISNLHLGKITGEVMKLTKGRAEPQIVNQLIKEMLEKQQKINEQGGSF